MPAHIQIPERPDVRIVHSTRRDGDFHPLSPLIDDVRAAISGHRWTQLSEDHGVEVREVSTAGAHDGDTGDVSITCEWGAVIGTWVGDCVPVVLLGREWIAGVHAGWRGARDGVLAAATDSMKLRDDAPVVAVIGAHVRPCCYEFGENDLLDMEARFGSDVRTLDLRGRSALDMGAVVRHALTEAAPRVRIIDVGLCTGCRADLFFSHRSRAEEQRHVIAAWREPSSIHRRRGVPV